MEEEIQTYFGKEVSIENLSRTQLIRALLKRHTLSLKPLKVEARDLQKRLKDLEEKREAARRERDRMNDEVVVHKGQRQKLHQLANEKRRKFFVLMEKLDDLETLDQEIDDYQDQLDKLEWELQTTVIKATSEKEMIDRIHSIYGQLTEINKEAQTKLGIQEKLSTLTKEIGNHLRDAQHHHVELLKKAEESEKYHTTFLEKGKLSSEVRIKLRRTERSTNNHKESMKYWDEWLGDTDE